MNVCVYACVIQAPINTNLSGKMVFYIEQFYAWNYNTHKIVKKHCLCVIHLQP